jgi:hypothetical protein
MQIFSRIVHLQAETGISDFRNKAEASAVQQRHSMTR